MYMAQREPLHLRLTTDAGTPFGKYVVLKRSKIPQLLLAYLRALGRTCGDAEVNALQATLDGMVALQGSDFFVMNLDEQAGRDAMAKYWAAYGYSHDEVMSCIKSIRNESHADQKEK
jgi:hypothetical protein